MQRAEGNYNILGFCHQIVRQVYLTSSAVKKVRLDVTGVHALEKEMATHFSILAWRIPATEEPGGLPSLGSHRVGHA